MRRVAFSALVYLPLQNGYCRQAASVTSAMLSTFLVHISVPCNNPQKSGLSSPFFTDEVTEVEDFCFQRNDVYGRLNILKSLSTTIQLDPEQITASILYALLSSQEGK